MSTDVTIRPATIGDVPRLLALSNACDRSWFGRDETDADEVEQRLRLAGDLDQRTRVIESPAGLIGYAVFFGSHDTQLMVAPDLAVAQRRETEDELLGWLIAAGADHLEAPSQATGLLAAFARHGFTPAWSSFELERTPAAAYPDVPLPAGVEVRPFDPDDHARAVHTLLYRFWSEVPSHNHRGFDEWRELFLGHASFDPSQQVVAWRGDRPVGAAICRMYTEDTGWILQLGVAPEDRGRGLGRALLVAASQRLGAVAGVATIGLSVFARNVRALQLYRSVGFEVTREWVTCQRTPVAPTS